MRLFLKTTAIRLGLLSCFLLFLIPTLLLSTTIKFTVPHPYESLQQGNQAKLVQPTPMHQIQQKINTGSPKEIPIKIKNITQQGISDELWEFLNHEFGDYHVEEESSGDTNDLEDKKNRQSSLTPTPTTPPPRIRASPRWDLIQKKLRTKNSIVIGIPSILRQGSTARLERTVQSVLNDLIDPEERSHHKVVVLNAEKNANHAAKLEKALTDRFSQFLDEGFLEIIRPPISLYRPLENPCALKRNHGDPLIRVLWRSKQVLDCAYLMQYCSEIGSYYLHLEDDTPLNPGWLKTMLRWTNNNYANRTDWGCLKFYSPAWFFETDHFQMDPLRMAGMIGLLVRSSMLNSIADHLFRKFDFDPVDWLMGDFLLSNNLKLILRQPPLIIHEDHGVSTKPKSLQDQDELDIPTWSKCDSQNGQDLNQQHPQTREPSHG